MTKVKVTVGSSSLTNHLSTITQKRAKQISEEGKTKKECHAQSFGSHYPRVGRKTLKLIQLSPRFHSRHLVGKRTAQKGTIKDITSDSKVNSYFPYRWSPASLTFNIYFFQFLYLYKTRITISNGTSHLNHQRTKSAEPPWDGQQ